MMLKKIFKYDKTRLIIALVPKRTQIYMMTINIVWRDIQPHDLCWIVAIGDLCYSMIHCDHKLVIQCQVWNE